MLGHSWGDSWEHWEELYKAGEWIEKEVYRTSLCRLQWKEKWGMLVYEHVWPPTYKRNGPIVQLPFPLFSKEIQGVKFPRYLVFWTSSWLYYKWMWWGDKMVGRAVKKACKKFPNVNKEIRAGIEWR